MTGASARSQIFICAHAYSNPFYCIIFFMLRALFNPEIRLLAKLRARQYKN
jgi:hypothetical protein